MKTEVFKDYLFRIQGKTIAVIYIFENEEAAGYKHYDIWKSDVISEWLLAIQENGCRPLIMDARTFIAKAINSTLPTIDAVINLNNGNIDLSTLSLIPSICSFINIPCIPCNAVSIISGENKLISNCIAKYCGLNLPKEIDQGESGIFRALNYGSSRGTYKTEKAIQTENGFSQEFIKGYDITTPLLYNPITEKLEILPTVMYYPENKDPEWFFNEDVKEHRGGYKKRILSIDKCTENYYKKLSQTMQINTFCRIDARVKCTKVEDWENLFLSPIPFQKIHFIEINPMPTLKKNINFYNSIDSINESSNFFEIYNMYQATRQSSTNIGFILFCSLISVLKPCIKEKGINSILTNKIQSNT